MKKTITEFSFSRLNAIKVIILFFSFLVGFSSHAQTNDTIKKVEKEFKNTIRFNVTNPLIFGSKSLIFGYERILKNNRSFSINIGQAALPNFEKGFSDEFREKTVLSEGGFHISGDYRFYLSKLNKYRAPRGVYIGPYFSYNRFSKGGDWQYNDENSNTKNINSDLSLKIQQIGFELGYQFVFWKRFSLDLILLGPGVAGYKVKASAEGNLTDEERQLFFEKLNQALKDKFPGYSGTIGEDADGEFEKSGSGSTTSLGYRYMINIGYRF